MKAKQIRELSNAEIIEKINELKKEIAKERAIIASGSRPDKPKKIRNARKDIARMLTILNERKLKERRE